MQSNPPTVGLQISRLFPQSSNRNHVTELALPDCSGIGQQAPTSVPQFYNYSYYGDPKRQAGYLRPEIGWSQQEHFQYQHPPPHHLGMRVITEREIEKEQIREEIIRSDIARRHVLEAEVRRVLMMEREFVPQRGSNGIPFSSLRTSLFESMMRLPCSVSRVQERWVLVDMIANLLEERERFNAMHETERLDTLPFQRGTSYVKISEVKPAFSEDNREEKIILLPKPDDNASGPKREAETLDALMKKKAKGEWSCAVCKFITFGEGQFNEHLQGRKHKNEESKMRRAHKGSKNYRTGLSSKKPTKHISAAQALPFIETQIRSLKKDHLPSLQISLNSHPWEKNESKLNPNIRMGEKLTKRRHRAHKRRKKRASRLHKLKQNCGAGQSRIPATIKEPQQW